MRNKKGWLRIVEAFIAVFIIISVALFVINESFIEGRDISEKIYAAEVQMLQEIIDEFGVENLNWYNGDVNTLDEYLYGGGETYSARRVPDYLDCGIALCQLSDMECDGYLRYPEGDVDEYVQSLPILEEESLLKINCWLA